MQKNTLVAVDTNVVLLLAAGDEITTDAWKTIKDRIPTVRFLVPPTVIAELAFKSREASSPVSRKAGEALRDFRTRWDFHPGILSDVQTEVARLTADRLREERFLPWEERQDALVLTESALLDCALLIMHDSHLRQISFSRMNLLLRKLDITPPVVATPREVVGKFYR